MGIFRRRSEAVNGRPPDLGRPLLLDIPAMAEAGLLDVVLLPNRGALLRGRLPLPNVVRATCPKALFRRRTCSSPSSPSLLLVLLEFFCWSSLSYLDSYLDYAS